MHCRAYYGLDLSGKLFPSLAPNDWWFAKLNMWHESLWFWNPGATHGSGATPAHQGARFADETCHADALHSYDEHIWRPMITDDPATGGERMASKPVRCCPQTPCGNAVTTPGTLHHNNVIYGTAVPLGQHVLFESCRQVRVWASALQVACTRVRTCPLLQRHQYRVCWICTCVHMQVLTNAYAVGFGKIDRGLNLRSEFLDFKWRALLSEVDMSYRQRDGSLDAGFPDLDRDITMCDWRSSFSDGSKMHSFPVPWPVKPAHAAEFYLANTLDHAAEMTGAISSRSWIDWNFYYWRNTDIMGADYYGNDLPNHNLARRLGDLGFEKAPVPPYARWQTIDRAWRDVIANRTAAGLGLPTGFEECQIRVASLNFNFEYYCYCNFDIPEQDRQCRDDDFCMAGDPKWGRCHEMRFQENVDATGCKCARPPFCTIKCQSRLVVICVQCYSVMSGKTCACNHCGCIGIRVNMNSKRCACLDLSADPQHQQALSFEPAWRCSVNFRAQGQGDICAENSPYMFARMASGAKAIQTDMLQRPMFDDWPPSKVPRRCAHLSLVFVCTVLYFDAVLTSDSSACSNLRSTSVS